jgi:hypothetical protein
MASNNPTLYRPSPNPKRRLLLWLLRPKSISIQIVFRALSLWGQEFNIERRHENRKTDNHLLLRKVATWAHMFPQSKRDPLPLSAVHRKFRGLLTWCMLVLHKKAAWMESRERVISIIAVPLRI